jgi:serine/threonine protein kinase
MATKRTGRLDPAEALGIALQVSHALVAAAKQQIVHGDLKPSNLALANQDGEKIVKVIGFGLSRSAMPEGGDAGTPVVAGFVGSPHFASPEQIEERDIDIRSDIYSLGVTLYYMLTGRLPFSGSIAKVMAKHLYQSVPLEPLEALAPQVISLVLSMMEKDRNKRPQNPTELQQRIHICLEDLR